jgi:hypothetical protein
MFTPYFCKRFVWADFEEANMSADCYPDSAPAQKGRLMPDRGRAKYRPGSHGPLLLQGLRAQSQPRRDPAARTVTAPIGRWAIPGDRFLLGGQLAELGERLTLRERFYPRKSSRLG